MMTGLRQSLKRVGDQYTLQGAAETLGVSYWSVYRYVRVAQVPTQRLGNLVLVRLDDLRGLSPEGVARGERAQARQVAAQPAAGSGARGAVCPECQSATLVFQEGCQKCLACGYAVC